MSEHQQEGKKKKVLKLKIPSVHGNVRYRIRKCICLRYSELETAVLKVLNYRFVRNEPIHFKWHNFISKHTVFEVKTSIDYINTRRVTAEERIRELEYMSKNT